jgi:hypothetical protein
LFIGRLYFIPAREEGSTKGFDFVGSGTSKTSRSAASSGGTERLKFALFRATDEIIVENARRAGKGGAFGQPPPLFYYFDAIARIAARAAP